MSDKRWAIWGANSWRCIVVALILMGILTACGGVPATVSPPGSFVEVRISDVLVASGSPNFVSVDPAARQPIQDGDRVRTSDAGQGILDLAACMRVLVFGGSNLNVERISVGNVTADGALLFSTTCPSVTINTNADPPEAVIQTTGTVFLAAYRPHLHMMLLWTQMGEATLSNWVDGHAAETMPVPAGMWSVVRQGAEPQPARPISEMSPILDEMGLREVYNEVVHLLETEGFGPAAPQPFDVGEAETPPSADDTPPTITRVAIAPAYPTTDDEVAFEIEARDEDSGLAAISVYLNDEWVWTCDAAGVNLATCAFTVAPYEAGNIRYLIQVSDQAGNLDLRRGELAVHPAASTGELVLAIGGGPLDDPRVQEAILRAVPWSVLLEDLYPGQGVGVMTEWRGQEIDARRVDYDLDLARKLMAEADYPYGFEALFLYPPDDPDIARLMKGILAHMVNLDIKAVTQEASGADASLVVASKRIADEPVVWLRRRAGAQ